MVRLVHTVELHPRAVLTQARAGLDRGSGTHVAARRAYANSVLNRAVNSVKARLKLGSFRESD